MSLHASPHPLAGQTVKLALAGPAADLVDGDLYRIEDWWDRVYGASWGVSGGNPAAMKYAIRSGLSGLPTDDEVVYGKVNGIGHLVHVSELVEPSAGDE
jgi:hypothetical protein